MTYTLITGGSRGIGKALAVECARRGMNLLLVARQADALEAASKEIMNAFSVQPTSVTRVPLRVCGNGAGAMATGWIY